MTSIAKIIRHFFTLALLIGLLSGCSEENLPLSNKVILIFQNVKNESTFSDQRSSIKYMDDQMIPHVINPFGEQKRVIYTSRKHLDIAYQDKEKVIRHFLLKNGDSVLIELKGKWPVVEILNRKANKYESNFENNKQLDIYGDKPSSLESYYYYWQTANNGINPIFGNIISEELQTLKKKAFIEIKKEHTYIDSLATFEIINNEIADFYQMKNQFSFDKLKLYESDKVNFSKTEGVEAITSKISNASSDSTSDFSFYTFHDDFITQYYQDYVFDAITSNTDFTSVLNQNHYNKTFNKHLLFKHVEQLLKSSSVEQGRDALDLFLKDSINRNWSNYLYSKYNLDQSFNTHWLISDNLNRTYNFESLLLENKGNLIYIDLWASWCLKSIKEMPALDNLIEDYATRKVVSIHISVDTDKEKWKWAENKYLRFNQLNSYKLDSLDLPILQKTFNVDFIPRYLLFDQKGNLIHGNAPKPSSEELRILLDSYLEVSIKVEN
ncbi:TlpA disulfide reductase family protein [Reichenbachiella sp. MALMAid0571]|uniref:TlpA family protein disulfide reductase n=1 Tax=Reichenbachiella sp. MALMAid0571 TaxID=3143939 RepID=UPI0032DF6EC1